MMPSSFLRLPKGRRENTDLNRELLTRDLDDVGADALPEAAAIDSGWTNFVKLLPNLATWSERTG